MNAVAGGGRQGILSLAVKDKAQLYNAYIPYVKNGGIFVPTPKRYFLGDEVFLLLTLPDSSERLPVAVALDREFHAAPFARCRAPGRLPEPIDRTI